MLLGLKLLAAAAPEKDTVSLPCSFKNRVRMHTPSLQPKGWIIKQAFYFLLHSWALVKIYLLSLRPYKAWEETA